MRRSGVALAVGVALLAASAAHAESSERVHVLAQRAADGDTAALEQLRDVREVDGRSVDLSRALGTSNRDALAARLRLLAQDAPPSAALEDPAAAAGSILDDRRYRGSEVPRPLHGVLSWLGERLRTLARPFRWLADQLPGGPPAGIVLLAALVVLAAAVAAWLTGRRRVGASVERAGRKSREQGVDPESLEREADAAEGRGDLAAAVRLRFRAGLARLSLAGAIPAGERTNGELRPLVDQQAFDRLAASLDAVAYGGRAPTVDEVHEARNDWGRVLSETGAR